MKKKEICIVQLNTDNAEHIRKFKEAWKLAQVERVIYVPADIKFKIKGSRK